MKKHLNKSRYSELPINWTIIRLEQYEKGDDGKNRKNPAILGFYAFNTRTGRRMPTEQSYDAALRSIPQSPHAEPWGV